MTSFPKSDGAVKARYCPNSNSSLRTSSHSGKRASTVRSSTCQHTRTQTHQHRQDVNPLPVRWPNTHERGWERCGVQVRLGPKVFVPAKCCGDSAPALHHTRPYLNSVKCQVPITPSSLRQQPPWRSVWAPAKQACTAAGAATRSKAGWGRYIVHSTCMQHATKREWRAAPQSKLSTLHGCVADSRQQPAPGHCTHGLQTQLDTAHLVSGCRGHAVRVHVALARANGPGWHESIGCRHTVCQCCRTSRWLSTTYPDQHTPAYLLLVPVPEPQPSLRVLAPVESRQA